MINIFNTWYFMIIFQTKKLYILFLETFQKNFSVLLICNIKYTLIYYGYLEVY